MSGKSKITILFILLLQLNILAQGTVNYTWMNEGFFFGRADFLINVISNIDGKGNFINAGSYSTFTDNMYIHKISWSSGDFIWKLDSRYPTKQEGDILDMIVDEKNNIYIAGYYFTVSPIWEPDTLFVKKIISANNTPQIKWEYRHIFGDDYHKINSREFKLARNDSCIVVTGITLNRKPLADIVTIKLDTNGTELWKKHYTNNDNYDVSPKDLTIDTNGNIFVYGNSVKEDSSSTQLIKYNSNGDFLWDRKIKNQDSPYISAVDLKISNGANWISANLSGETLLLKIDSIGNTVKEIRRETSGSNLGLSIDESQNVYQINNDSVFKYDSSGNLVSSVQLPSLSNVEYSYFTVDQDQNIYIVGQRTHFYTVKLNENLEFEFAFETAWEDPPHLHREFSKPYDIAVSSNHEIYISGDLITWDSLNFNSSSAQVSIKYSTFPTEVKENEIQQIVFNLSQNYPNPFNPTTIIKYQISNNVFPSGGEGVNVQLKVYDILGKQIATLVSKEQSAGSYEVEFLANELPSGVYFYRLQAGSFIETKKMVLLR